MKIFGYKSNGGRYSDFGYRDEYNYGMTCGVIIADSIEEAKEILDYDNWDGREIFEIPFEKGYTCIGEYSE